MSVDQQVNPEGVATFEEVEELALSCNSRQKFFRMMEKINQLIPFDCWTVVLGQFSKDDELIGHLYYNTIPQSWQAEYIIRIYKKIDPVLLKALEEKNPNQVYRWNDIYNEVLTSEESELKKKQLKFIVRSQSHANLVDGLHIDYFKANFSHHLFWSVAGPSVEYSGKSAELMKRLAPLLLGALEKIVFKENWKAFTEEEKTILNAIGNGVSFEGICEELETDVASLKYKLGEIYHKLGVENFPNAIVRAITFGLIKNI